MWHFSARPRQLRELGASISMSTVPARYRKPIFAALLALTLVASGCATPPNDPIARAEFERTNDPFEPTNREILEFNLFLDRVLLTPVALGYRALLPQYPRNRLRNFLDNLNEPVVF